ncbi:hypothetical protein Tco_0218709 [Tanacetum coccineum]
MGRFLALGWHLEEIHVIWAYLEKKRTRLRTYTKSLEELHKDSYIKDKDVEFTKVIKWLAIEVNNTTTTIHGYPPLEGGVARGLRFEACGSGVVINEPWFRVCGSEGMLSLSACGSGVVIHEPWFRVCGSEGVSFIDVFRDPEIRSFPSFAFLTEDPQKSPW